MYKFFVLIFVLSFTTARAQTPAKLNSAEIHEAIKKLNFLGSVLYIAAHPDDENTRLISYLANEVKARTTYLSITRGDGGQNLIGPQLKEQLGIIRTRELLAARDIDGGEQFFTRAIDFGYTKTPEEALEFWGKDKVVSDVVWAMRTLQPDIVINRFNHRTSGETHGQHTASALLGVEAFDLAGDPKAFAEQLKFTDTFAPKRLFFNTSPWFYGSDEEFEKADKSNLLKFDTGVYFPSKGLSNPEIAALSRSEHQSQGFGSTGSRGEQVEYLELIKGDLPQNKEDLFAGIDTSWKRVKTGAPIGDLITTIEKEYNFRDPSASLPKLLQAYSLINKLEGSHWKTIKLEEIKEIIASAAGLYLEAVAVSPTTTPASETGINLEVINRSKFPMTLVSVELEPNNSKLEPGVALAQNSSWKKQATLKTGEKAGLTSPYWLRKKGSIGLYEVEDQKLVGLPQNPKSVKAKFTLNMAGVSIPYERAIVFKYNDPVKGEVYQPFEIVPPVSAAFREMVLIFANGQTKSISVNITAYRDNVEGEITLQVPGNWKIVPEENRFQIAKKGGSVTVNFSITPPSGQEEAVLIPQIKIDGKLYSEEIIKISYDHIPEQTLVVPAETKVVKLDIEKRGENIGYIDGAGDVIPQSLQQIGYWVTRIDPAGITSASLENYDAVVMGIRAYNTIDALKFSQPALLKYVENGGTLIVQYNVNRGLVTSPLAPFPLNLSRDRVTEEDSEVRFKDPAHPVLNYPNKLSSRDFEGWVQERGLYFADSWGPEFTPVLSMNDTNENPTEGSLLVAKHGKGYFIYTGISFFRQFPEGVPGAYRLFANMVSIGK
ncbi:PIG-L family deacetylase [Antarcticibacterium arcticum]|uniref:PIG-L family deacetylase n=1 Tax=Antarcticibacterium arcticum TaxID=2585771 RepID=A0A5B8YFX5_9FLAO|nr:PIG-L family deacetylase [Antarcticibacterium arcticum]QED36825.1 PIG-L family deacetylase [Antarcticibacterium arcticum]